MRNATIILYLKHRANTKRDKIQFNHIRNLLNLSQWRNSRILIYQCTCTECLSKPPKKSITFWHFSTPAEECGSEIDINSSAILQHSYSSTPSQQRERERDEIHFNYISNSKKIWKMQSFQSFLTSMHFTRYLQSSPKNITCLVTNLLQNNLR